MAALLGDVRKILAVKMKTRQDSHTDQYNRLVMVKVMLISSFAVGMNWFKDKLKCIVPKSSSFDGGFVGDACWINGFYVYADLKHVQNSLGYYGIPTDVSLDGIYANGKYCATVNQQGLLNEDCTPLTKTFFLQYQWYPFFLASLAFLFYLPYMAFTLASNDTISLRKAIKEGDEKKISKTFFDYSINSPKRMRIRIVIHVLVKILYIIANVASFMIINNTFYGEFSSYGKRWLDWSNMGDDQFDYTKSRAMSKPGERMLPTFGLCDVLEGARDERHMINNEHRVVCEYSTNVLYHYVLILLWFLLIIGTVISVIGLIFHIVSLVLIKFGDFANKKWMQKDLGLSLREKQYLDIIRKKAPILHQKVIDELMQERLGTKDGETPDATSEKAPMYPEGLRQRPNVPNY